jgi:hypothetical protein
VAQLLKGGIEIGTEVAKYLTPWSKVVLGKLIVTQPLKRLPTFYGAQRFITVLRKSHHWSLP